MVVNSRSFEDMSNMDDDVDKIIIIIMMTMIICYHHDHMISP